MKVRSVIFAAVAATLAGAAAIVLATPDDTPHPAVVELGGHLADMHKPSGRSMADAPVRNSALIVEWGAGETGGVPLVLRDGNDVVTIPWAALGLTVGGTVDVITDVRATYVNFALAEPGRTDAKGVELLASADEAVDIAAIADIYSRIAKTSWPRLSESCTAMHASFRNCDQTGPSATPLDPDDVVETVEAYMTRVRQARATNDYEIIDGVGPLVLGGWRWENGAALHLVVQQMAFAPPGGRPLRHLEPSEMIMRPILILSAYSHLDALRIGAIRHCLRGDPPWKRTAGEAKEITSTLLDALGPPVLDGRRLDDPVEAVQLAQQKSSASLRFWDHNEATICSALPP